MDEKPASGSRRRRPKGDGGLYRRASDGMWIGAIDLGFRDGKRRRITVAGKTKSLARMRLQSKKDELALRGGITYDGSSKLEAWLEYWIEEIVKPHDKPRTYISYRTDIRHIVPVLGAKRLDRLGPDDLRGLIRLLQEKGYAPRTVNHVHQCLSVALEAAHREGKVPRNIARLVKRAPEPRGPGTRRAYSAPQVRRLLDAALADPAGARWSMHLLSGTRQGEALGLRWSSVDLNRDVMQIGWQLQALQYEHGCGRRREDGVWPCGKTRGDFCPDRRLRVPASFEIERLYGRLALILPKSAHSIREVPIVPVLHERLERLRETIKPGKHDLLWARPDGEPITPSDDDRGWSEFVNSAGLPGQTIHVTRHTVATLLLESGVDQLVVSHLLGHSTRTDLRMLDAALSSHVTSAYQHVSLDLKRTSLDRLVELIYQSPRT